MSRKLIVSLTLITCAMFCTPATTAAWAQAGASLSGVIRDPQGAAVPGARINIYPQGASSPMATQSGPDGAYRVSLPSGGVFVVEALVEGFRNSSEVVSVGAGEAANLDVSLVIAGVSSTILVTAADAPQTVDQITKAISVIDAAEILNRGEFSIPSILATTPGIQVRNGGGVGQFSQIRVRGLRPDATAVLIDGLRFRDTASPQTDSTAFASNLNFVSADRVEVLRGSGSSLYGTNAAGGVINIVTDDGGGAVRGTVQAEGGNTGFARGRVQIGGGARQDRLRYSAGLLHLNVSRGVDGNDAARTIGGQGFLRYDLKPSTYVSARFFASDDFVQLNTGPSASGIPAGNFPATGIIEARALAPEQVENLLNRQPVNYGDATYVPGYDDPDNRRTSRYNSTALKFQHSLSSGSNVQVSYQNLYTVRYYDNGPSGVGPFQPMVRNYGKYAGRTDTIDGRFNIPLAPWSQLTVGYEFEREGYGDELDDFLPTSARLQIETSSHQNAHSGYFQNQLSFLDSSLQISLSGRVQVFRLERPTFEASGASTPYDSVPLQSPPKALTGDASISYFMEDSGTKLRVHVGNAYRSPGLYERFGGGFYNDVANGRLVFTPYGDPRLSPDRYNSVDGGIDQYVFDQRVRLSATYFYTRVVSVTAFDSGVVIQFPTDPYGRSFGYINGSGGISRGLEVGVESRPTGNLILSGSYAYTRSNTDRDLNVRGFYQTLNVPRHTFSLVATQRIGGRADVTVDVVGNGESFWPFFAGSRNAIFRFPSFVKTDVSGSVMLMEGDGYTVKANTRIENLFDRQYYEAGYLAAGTTVVAGLSYQF